MASDDVMALLVQEVKKIVAELKEINANLAKGAEDEPGTSSDADPALD